MIFWVACAAPGPTVEGDLVLASRHDVAAASGVVEVWGHLVVEGTALDDVSLPMLESVGGEVRIWENDTLTTWSTPSLEQVGQDLSLYDNPSLSDLGDLSAVERIDGVLRVTRMPAIRELRSPGLLQRIGGLYVYANDALEVVDLGSLAQILGDVDLWELPALREVDLGTVASIEGRLDLFDNDQLVRVAAPRLQDLRTYELHHCDAMTDAGAFPELWALPGDLTLQYNDALVSLGDVGQISRLRSATIRFNGSLEELRDWELERVDDTLTVGHNRAMTSLSATSLVDVRVLEIVGHQRLSEVGLISLSRVQGMRIVDNVAWSTCAAEDLLARVSPTQVVCHGNAPDGCGVRCTEEAP